MENNKDQFTAESLTVGDLRKRIEKLPDDATLTVERGGFTSVGPILQLRANKAEYSSVNLLRFLLPIAPGVVS